MNIIPIIAKADTVSKSELHKFKIKIMGELVSNGVQIYQFPTDDEAVAEINAVMNVSVGQGPWGSGARGLGASPRPLSFPWVSTLALQERWVGIWELASPASSGQEMGRIGYWAGTGASPGLSFPRYEHRART